MGFPTVGMVRLETRSSRDEPPLAIKRRMGREDVLDEFEHDRHAGRVSKVLVNVEPELPLRPRLVFKHAMQRRVAIRKIGRKHADPDPAADVTKLHHRACAAKYNPPIANGVPEPVQHRDFDQVGDIVDEYMGIHLVDTGWLPTDSPRPARPPPP